MTYIVIQTLTAFFTFVFLALGINFIIPRQSTGTKRAICVTIGVISFILATLSAVYFIYDIFFLNIIDDGYHWLKLGLFIIALIVFVACVACSLSERNNLIGGCTLIVLAVCMTLSALFIGSMEAWEIESQQRSIYNQKVIAQDPKIVVEKYELLSLKDNTNIEGSFSGNIDGSLYGGFFVMRGTLQGTQNGEIKNIDVYKFYYVADNEPRKILPKTLYAEQTPICPIAEGETPYLVKITSTPYSLDYNVDPAKECNFGEATVTYELHIPETAILNQFILDSE